MCTRYYIEPDSFTELFAALKSQQYSSDSLRVRMMVHYAKPFKTEGEIRPTDIVPVIATSASGRQAVFPMYWGYSPKPGGNGLFNCRVETTGEKPLWRESYLRRRCIIPASYYFEWEHFVSQTGAKKTGAKYIIQPKDSTVTWLSGIYRIEEDGFPHFVALTREPAENLKAIHDRMPVILPQDAISTWINPLTSVDDIKKIENESLAEMVYEKAELLNQPN